MFVYVLYVYIIYLVRILDGNVKLKMYNIIVKKSCHLTPFYRLTY